MLLVFQVLFNYFPLRNKVEGALVTQQHKLYLETLSAAHCMTDEWFGMTAEQARALKRPGAKSLGKSGDAPSETAAETASSTSLVTDAGVAAGGGGSR